jgi:hypothetical protein
MRCKSVRVQEAQNKVELKEQKEDKNIIYRVVSRKKMTTN